MLPQENRLKKKKDFEKVFKMGKGYREDFLFLKTTKNNLKESRFGFIVSKKISNKAVIRNKIKRRLRAIIQKKIPRMKKGMDIVIVTLPGIEDKSFQEIEKNVNKIFAKNN
jgi:ribonuclease P protein component